MMGPRKKVDILSNQLPNDSGNDSIEKKKMQEKLLQQSHTVGLSEVDDCLLESCDYEYKGRHG